MANKRIKDLATTATTTASDDFMAVDGATNGTRKLSAATPAFLTSVTTPSLTAPASTNLTLGTGTSGAAITVLSASNNVGIGTVSPTHKLDVVGTGTVEAMIQSTNSGQAGLALQGAAGGWTIYKPSASSDLRFYDSADRVTIQSGGVVSISNTTAGSSGAGALVVQGGISAAGASYFNNGVSLALGSLLNFVGGTNATYAIQGATSASPYDFRFIGVEDAVTQRNFSFGYYTGDNKANAWNEKIKLNGYTGAATFAGAVTAVGLVTAGQVANVSATNSLLAKGYAVGGYGDYGSILLSASAANTSGARQFLVTNAHNATGFAIIRSTNATTPPTLDTNGVVSSGTVDFAISNAGAATFAGTVTVANANGIDINSGGSTAIFTQSISSVRKNFIYFDGTDTIYGADTGAIILSPSSVVQVASGKALKLGNAYVGTPVVSTGYITIQDSTGTTYKVAVSL